MIPRIPLARPIPAGVCLTALAFGVPVFGQSPPDPADAPSQHQHVHSTEGQELFPPREGSGTSWLPDDTPMFGVERQWGGWTIMLHGAAFPQFLYEPADPHRTGGFSSHQFSVVNWGMLQARRSAGRARVGLRAMVSLEPWALRDCGYISYLATGELCEGDTIHDRQHPHDLFMELAADYDRPLLGSWRWQAYGGLSGEPALGPVSFPHRTSAMLNPIAPISHHWMDATHISFGVVTLGAYDQRWKIEGSLFNGREPDENRADFDLGALDSFSGRITFLANERLAIQVSAGHLEEAEQEFAPQPRNDIDRLTASATYHRRLGPDGIWASTLAYGMNSGLVIIPDGQFDASTQALVFESTVTLRDTDTFFGRAEIVEKPAEELHAHEFARLIFTLGKLQAGYVREVKPWRGLKIGFGGTASISIVPQDLASRYDGRVAPGFGVFVSLRPARHVM
jgi:hypothetical protein